MNKEDENTHQYIKCANCNGNHLAFSRDCTVYQKRIEAVEKRRMLTGNNNKKQAYVPAPLPTTNPWNSKKSHEAPAPRWPNNNLSSVAPPKMNENAQNKDAQATFNTLVSELNMLNQLIDLEKMVRLVRTLNSQLRGCTNELDKFLKFNQFCQTYFMTNDNSATRCQP